MRPGPALALVGLALVTSQASAADTGTLSGKLTDGKPPAAAGRAVVRAINASDGRIAGATEAGPSGAWKLALDPGRYVLTAAVVQTGKPVVSAIAPLQTVRSGRTTKAPISLKRTKTPKAKKKKRKARKGARAAATMTAPVGVRAFTGSGPNAQLGRGLAEMVITELTTARSGDCEADQVELIRRQDILKEIALANSNLVAPGSRIPAGHLVDPTYVVQGTVDTTSTTTSWDLQIVDAQGNSIGGDSGTANGLDILDAAEGIAQRLLDQLCGSDYQVLVNIQATIVIAPYSGIGTMTADVPVKDVSGAKPPTLWQGQAPAVFSALSYGGVPGCDVLAGPHGGTIKVEIRKSATPGQIEVQWGGPINDATTLVCPNAPPIPNGVPPIEPLLGTKPGFLILPESGGTQSVSGGAGTAGGAWSNSGTVTVIRVPKGTV